MNLYYGVASQDHLVNSARQVVAKLGGGRNALILMLGTCAAETHCASYPDRHPEKLGVGLGQCDEIALVDVKAHIRPHDSIAMQELGYDIQNVKLEDLALDPLLAFAIMRLVYKRKPEPLPSCSDLEAQGRYWKKYYNSALGAGTASKYVEEYKNYVPSEFQ
ncbi:hypothetical protein [Alteromonas phage JH01]|nr:hypothetical protein [Alteromonas phage JH01]